MSGPTRFEVEVPMVPKKLGGRPVPPLSMNQRIGWRRRHELVKLVRTSVYAAVIRLRVSPARHVRVQLHYAPGNLLRHDGPNLCATSKPAIDGLVDAGLVPDDTAEWLTEVMPVIHPGRGVRRLWLEVEITR